MTKDLKISQKAIDLILEFEGFTGRVDWPGGMSGVTIGFGYDLGYHTAQEIRRDWSPHVPKTVLNRLADAAGIKGASAKEVAARMKDIAITRTAANAVFQLVDVPRWIQRASGAFPGYDALPDDVQGGLVSLVFNRGTRMPDAHPALEERREMRAIRDAILSETLTDGEKRSVIAAELRLMKRLWDGSLPAPYDTKFRGLIRRREAEAKLVEGV